MSVTPPGADLRAFELKWIMSEEHTLFLRYERPAAERTDHE